MVAKALGNKKGMSLVEVLVSAFLIVLVFSGFISVYYSSANLRANSQKRLQALQSAQTCLEDIRARRGDGGSSWSDMDGLEIWLENDEGYARSGGSFTRDSITISISKAGTTGILDELIHVRVEAAYSDEMNKGGIKSVVLETRFKEL